MKKYFLYRNIGLVAVLFLGVFSRPVLGATTETEWSHRDIHEEELFACPSHNLLTPETGNGLCMPAHEMNSSNNEDNLFI